MSNACAIQSSGCLETDALWFVDGRFSAEESVVLRYRNLHSFGLGLAELLQSSLGEGCRILPLLHYRGVDIELLDAVSLTATGTFKSIDACVVSARLKQAGIRKCAVASGGNTGFARAVYAERLGIETFWFYPAENEDLIPAEARNRPLIHLFPIQDPGRVKAECNAYMAEHRDVHAIPTEWKTSSFESLGGFIIEHALRTGPFDWIAQTVSAAFAPLGYYRAMQELCESGAATTRPRFLGVQQEENCFMFKAWNRQTQQQPITSTHDLLLPVIFDTEPHTYKTQEQFFSLLRDSRGDLTTISRQEFSDFEDGFVAECRLVDLLRKLNIPVRVEDQSLVEPAGFVALAGVLKAIDAGTIATGSRVLSVLSGS